MKEKFSKLGKSNLFKELAMFTFSLACLLFGVGGVSAMTANAVIPADGGAVRVGEDVTVGNAHTDSPDVILAQIDDMVAKIRPYDAKLDTISRHVKQVKSSSGQVVKHYAIDTIDLTATLSTAVAGGTPQRSITTSNNSIFACDQTIIVNGVNGYKEDKITVDTVNPLVLYVLNKDASDNPIVVAVNGQTAANNIPAIPAGTVLTRAGRAGSEEQLSTDAYSGVPTNFTQYLQKFLAKVKMSDLFERAAKEVNWTFTDAEEEAIFDMKRTQNVSFWKGVKGLIKAKNKYTETAEEIYFTQGIWTQAGKEFDFSGAVNSDTLVDLMEHAFTGNNSGENKLFIVGSALLSAIEKVDYNKVIYVGEKQEAFGIVFNSIESKFGTLLCVHDKSLDDIGMTDKGFILDPNNLRKWTVGDLRVTDFDLKKTGISDSDARGIMEICGLILKNPKAHSRVALDGWA